MKKRGHIITYLNGNQVQFIEFDGKPGVAFDPVPIELANNSQASYKTFLFNNNEDLIEFSKELLDWAEKRLK